MKLRLTRRQFTMTTDDDSVDDPHRYNTVDPHESYFRTPHIDSGSANLAESAQSIIVLR